MRCGLALLAMVMLFAPPLFAQAREVAAAQSQCFGTASRGRLEHGVQLPVSGPNFSTYSSLAAIAGRTHVHSRVAQVIVAAYAALATAAPGKKFVYGETGWPSGGRFRPHRTHQNGLSVDFFVPVLNAAGESVPLPTSLTQKLGYDIEFDVNAGTANTASISTPSPSTSTNCRWLPRRRAWASRW